MFGIFGVILASGYLLQGVTYIRFVVIALARRSVQTLVWSFAIMSLDFFFGLSLMIAAIGLLLVKEWARKVWLITMSLLVLVHLTIIVLNELAEGVSGFYLIWTWMVLLATFLSWWYLSQSSIRERFSPPKNETVETVPPQMPPDPAL
jgi:hypothetical protein